MKIRLNEEQFKRLIAESVKKVLNEGGFSEEYDEGMPTEEGIYVCEEDSYDEGTTGVYLGGLEDARNCAMSSAGNWYGPYDTEEEAEAKKHELEMQNNHLDEI